MTVCLTPITLKRDKYKDRFGSMTNVVSCGKCPNCIKRRQLHWIFRLQMESKYSESVLFTTLTYDEQNIPITENGFKTYKVKDYQNFIKKVRKIHDGKKHIKYYAVAEYGSKTERPHFHQILFNASPIVIDNFNNLWGHGLTDLQQANNAAVAYVTGYLDKRLVKKTNNNSIKKEDDRLPERNFMSKGLGKQFLTPAMIRYMREGMKNVITVEGGKIISLPRYYKEKIYDAAERKEISFKSQQFAKKNEMEFESSNHEADYIRNKFIQRNRKNKLTRNIL